FRWTGWIMPILMVWSTWNSSSIILRCLWTSSTRLTTSAISACYAMALPLLSLNGMGGGRFLRTIIIVYCSSATRSVLYPNHQRPKASTTILVWTQTRSISGSTWQLMACCHRYSLRLTSHLWSHR
ncbi:hypothetical protein C0995_006356, partial [Termitomyces sp. Mi166